MANRKRAKGKTTKRICILDLVFFNVGANLIYFSTIMSFINNQRFGDRFGENAEYSKTFIYLV
jgi:hypothetical protein